MEFSEQNLYTVLSGGCILLWWWRTVGQIPKKCKETSNLMWLSLIWFIVVLFVCWNLFCTLANLRIKCVTETKNVSLLFYKNLKPSFSTWLTGFFTFLVALTHGVPSTIFARFDSLSALIIDIRNAYESSHSIFIQVMLCCWKLRKNNLAPSKLDQSTAWWPQASFRQAIALNQGYFYQARLYLSAEFESVIRKAQNICAKVS